MKTPSDMTKISISVLEAYAQFLHDEKERHRDDIRMIEGKEAIMRRRGIIATRRGDWISETELMECEITD